MLDYKKIFIEKLNYTSDIAYNENGILLINTFKNLIKFVDTTTFNEQIKRNIDFYDNYQDVVIGIHKEYRQTDVFGSSELDLMFWNLIGIDFINKIYSDIIKFICDELPNKTGDFDKIIEDYIYWDENNFKKS